MNVCELILLDSQNSEEYYIDATNKWILLYTDWSWYMTVSVTLWFILAGVPVEGTAVLPFISTPQWLRNSADPVIFGGNLQMHSSAENLDSERVFNQSSQQRCESFSEPQSFTRRGNSLRQGSPYMGMSLTTKWLHRIRAVTVLFTFTKHTQMWPSTSYIHCPSIPLYLNMTFYWTHSSQ